MMTLLAKGLTWLLGSKLLPMGLAGALLITGHQLWLARDARIAKAATATCEASWELAQKEAELRGAKRELAAHKEQLEREQVLTEELRNDRRKIRDEFAAHKAAASADPRCLSDGVLQLLGADGGVGKAR